MAEWIEHLVSSREIWVRITPWLMCQGGDVIIISWVYLGTFGKCLKPIPRNRLETTYRCDSTKSWVIISHRLNLWVEQAAVIGTFLAGLAEKCCWKQVAGHYYTVLEDINPSVWKQYYIWEVFSPLGIGNAEMHYIYLNSVLGLEC